MPGYDTVNANHMITTGNTTIKSSLEAYRMFMELLSLMIRLIPEPSVANTMRSEMEKGNVEVDLFRMDDKDALKASLGEKGLKEGKDFILANYTRQDGEQFAALFYNVCDKEKFADDRFRFDPSGAVNRENLELFEAVSAAGINADRTINMDTFDKFCKSKGVNLDFNGQIAKEDKEFAMSLFESEFTKMSPQQREAIAQKMVASGAINTFYAARAAGIVEPQALRDLSINPETKQPEVQNLKDLSFEQVMAIGKRAEANGLRVSVTGPNHGSEYVVSFAAKDQWLMERVFAEANYDLHGRAGELYKEQLQFEAEYHTEAIEALSQKTYPDGDKVKNGSMLVGMKIEPMRDRNGNPILDPKTRQPVMGRQTAETSGNRIYFNEEAKKTDPGAQTAVSGKNSKDLVKNMFGDSGAVLLNPEDAKAYKEAETEKERMKILQLAQERGEHGLPAKPKLDRESCEIIQKHEQMRQLVERKLQDEYSTGDKMAGYVYSISPYEMFANDQLINGEESHDMREYFRGGNNFMNEAGLESGQFADALSDEDQRFVNEAFDTLYEQQMAFEEMEDVEESTAQFTAWGDFDVILSGGQSGIDDFSMELDQEESIGDAMEDMEASGMS